MPVVDGYTEMQWPDDVHSSGFAVVGDDVLFAVCPLKEFADGIAEYYETIGIGTRVEPVTLYAAPADDSKVKELI